MGATEMRFGFIIRVALLALVLASPATVAGADESPNCLKPQLPDEHQWLLFFGPHDTSLSERAKNVLDELVKLAGDDKPLILIAGATDTSETAPEDADLSTRRGIAVRDYLVAAGLSPHRVFFDATGSLPLLVPTPAGVAEPQNRRAEITVPFGYTPTARWKDRQACVDWMLKHCFPSDSTDASCKVGLHYLLYR